MSKRGNTAPPALVLAPPYVHCGMCGAIDCVDDVWTSGQERTCLTCGEDGSMEGYVAETNHWCWVLAPLWDHQEEVAPTPEFTPGDDSPALMQRLVSYAGKCLNSKHTEFWDVGYALRDAQVELEHYIEKAKRLEEQLKERSSS